MTRELLKASVDGRGLVDSCLSPNMNSWVTNPYFPMTGREFVKMINVRLKTLNTPVRKSRQEGQGDPPFCKVDGRPADINHITQSCGVTHGMRVKRHDALMKSVKLSMKRQGWICYSEPRIGSGNSFLKPDLVALKRGRGAVVIDACVVNDKPGELSVLASGKRNKYDNEDVRGYAREKYCELYLEPLGDSDFKVYGLPIMNRGAIQGEVMKQMRSLGISVRYMTYLCKSTLTFTWGCWNLYRSDNLT